MKVWIVEEGAYENCAPVGVFSTKEKAEEFIREQTIKIQARGRSAYFGEPEEFEVDAKLL